MYKSCVRRASVDVVLHERGSQNLESRDTGYMQVGRDCLYSKDAVHTYQRQRSQGQQQQERARFRMMYYYCLVLRSSSVRSTVASIAETKEDCHGNRLLASCPLQYRSSWKNPLSLLLNSCAKPCRVLARSFAFVLRRMY